MAKKIKPMDFSDIHRGTTLTIPIVVKKSDGTPFDLTGFKAIFTLKPVQSDFDYDDDRAYITKEFEPYTDDPNKIGRIDMTLTSKETWLPPGKYYFDVVLMKGNASARVVLAYTNIVGGPTNHNVRHDQDQDGFILMDPIEVFPDNPDSIPIEVPFVTDPPENIVEGIVGDPQYVVQNMDDPARHVLIRNYGPRVSLMMTLKVPHDHTNHNYRFDQFFLNGNIPAPCPLKNGYIQFNNRRVNLVLSKTMHSFYHRMSVIHAPELKFDGGVGEQLTNEPYFVDDNVAAGQIVWHLHDENDQIYITAQHFIPDDHFGFEIWMLRIDWFNWVDPWEPDPERDDVGTHFPADGGCPVADTWPGFWPPDMWYCFDDKEYAKAKGPNTKCPGSIL